MDEETARAIIRLTDDELWVVKPASTIDDESVE